MSNKFTPGPWIIEDVTDAVGMVSQQGSSRVICRFPKAGAESKPNARLIAAAPELLEACLEAVAHYQEGGHLNWLSLCKAAIAKATGDSK